MRRRLYAWWSLSTSDRLVFLWMLVWLPLISLSLLLAGHKRTLRCVEWLSRVPARRTATSADLQSAQSLARLAGLAGRYGAIGASCLRQSLLVYGWLRRRGLDPDLKLGVRKKQGQFDAHSWVELDGSPLAQTGLDHVAFPSQRRHSVAPGESKPPLGAG